MARDLLPNRPTLARPVAAPTRTLFERVGGRATLERVHRLLYNRIYVDRDMGPFFADVPRERQEKQLTDFMSGAMGGPMPYVGSHPREAHRHMLITADLFDRRHRFLTEALAEAGVASPARDEWLRIDGAFKRILVKARVEDCTPRYTGGPILTSKGPVG